VHAESALRQAADHARLMDELLREGVNVALPMHSDDIDMLLYVKSGSAACTIVSVPINVVSCRSDGLSRHLRGASAAGLLVVIVSSIDRLQRIRNFALTPAELTVMKMIETIGRAAASRPGDSPNDAQTQEATLQNALEPFAMTPGKWRRKIADFLQASPLSSA
jgi:hypothetical protein